MAERRRHILGTGGSDQGGAARRTVERIAGGRPPRLPAAANDNRAPLRLQLTRAAVLAATLAGLAYILLV